jgi:ABC-2 type transport system permease protein
MNGFSFRRLTALLRKEWIQVRRDPMTLRLIIALPIMQLFLFGYAINANPKHLPTGLLLGEPSKYQRTIVTALQNTGYYDVRLFSSETEAEHRSVDRGEAPSVLVDADGTDPTAIGSATAALSAVVSGLNRDLPPIRQAQPVTPSFQFVVHARYNPEQLTVLNVVPGLICIVLTMSTLVITALSITRERERGTMENLIAMPVRPIEIMLAKIVPYIFVGYVQVVLILAISAVVFGLPVRGSLTVLMLTLGLFIASNLALGLTFSVVSTNQMQAQQLAQFTLLPSFLLSGFVFPFQGMPVWAQWLGELFPMTHAIRIVRGLLLKGNGLDAIAPELWPIALITVASIAMAAWFYRETLD